MSVAEVMLVVSPLVFFESTSNSDSEGVIPCNGCEQHVLVQTWSVYFVEWNEMCKQKKKKLDLPPLAKQQFTQRTLGNVIFECALWWINNRPSDSSNKKTENARCNIPCGWFLVSTCDSFFDALPMMLSRRSNTSTVSLSINASCVRPAPHGCSVDNEGALVLPFSCCSCIMADEKMATTKKRTRERIFENWFGGGKSSNTTTRRNQ